MRLRQIKLAGFKSFATPVTIGLPGMRIGIVGPNGCGKSNVIDAVRWVLGESQARQLRGETLDDVLFNSTHGRPPVSRASVELTFDNNGQTAAGPWSQYAEIAIRRVAERQGASSYFINGIRVRRREVADLFLGTGLGTRGYGIIEQGLISRILEARPEELRLFLEEAAGVFKYRERRRETETRLADTCANLMRLRDLRDELARQLERLDTQARVARQYRNLQNRRETAHQLIGLVRRTSAALLGERLCREEVSLCAERDAEIAWLQIAAAEVSGIRGRQAATAAALDAAQGAWYEISGEATRLEGEIRLRAESRRRIEAQLAALESQRNAVACQLAEIDADTCREHDGLAHGSADAEAAQTRLAAARAGLPDDAESHRRAERNLADRRRQADDAKRLHEVAQARELLVAKSLARLDERRACIDQEAKALAGEGDGANVAAQHADALRQLAAWRQELNRSEEALAAAETGRAESENVRADAVRALDNARTHLHALDLVEKREDSNQPVGDWLSRHGLDASPPLWQAIAIEAGWGKAVGAVLRARLGARQADCIEPQLAHDVPPAGFAVFHAGGRQSPGRRPTLPTNVKPKRASKRACSNRWWRWATAAKRFPTKSGWPRAAATTRKPA